MLVLKSDEIYVSSEVSNATDDISNSKVTARPIEIGHIVKTVLGEWFCVLAAVPIFNEKAHY